MKRKKLLHKTPAEFAAAEKAYAAKDWQQRMERALRRAKQDHERIMSAHLSPLTPEGKWMKVR